MPAPPPSPHDPADSADAADAADAFDADSLAALGQIDALLQRGSFAAALVAANHLFVAPGVPPALLSDLYKLTAIAAQGLELAPLAESMWRHAALHATCRPDLADVLLNLGVLLAGLGRHDEAERCWRDAIAFVPGHAEALANLAVHLAAQRRHDDAEAHYRRALAIAPEVATTHSNLGVLLTALHRDDEAEACLRRALALAPDDAMAHTNLGLVLQALKRSDEAERHQRQALALAPDSAEIHSNLGNLLASRGHEAQAEASLRRAIALAPASAAAPTNLAVLLADQGRDTEAEALFRQALQLRPGYPLAQLDLSCLLLAQGRFEEGWRLHEARHHPELPDNGIPPPNLAMPAWQGESLAGRALLIWPEQGLGDQLQFCRYTARLKALGAARITLVCQRPLQALFETLTGVDRVIAADIRANAFHVDEAALVGHDGWTFPLSLPRWLGTDLSTLPEASIPYLHASAARAPDWAPRSTDEAGTRRIGLVWRGNPLHNNDAERSLPGLAPLAPLWSIEGLRFISLQTGAAAAEAEQSPPLQPVLNAGSALRDFADTAAALEAIDLLICVDTSIAHLAGALGRPCWVLLPQRKTDWRWLRERDDSPWYPNGMRLFRQTRRGDWAEVIERVQAALQAWVAAG